METDDPSTILTMRLHQRRLSFAVDSRCVVIVLWTSPRKFVPSLFRAWQYADVLPEAVFPSKRRSQARTFCRVSRQA